MYFIRSSWPGVPLADQQILWSFRTGYPARPTTLHFVSVMPFSIIPPPMGQHNPLSFWGARKIQDPLKRVEFDVYLMIYIIDIMLIQLMQKVIMRTELPRPEAGAQNKRNSPSNDQQILCLNRPVRYLVI